MNDSTIIPPEDMKRIPGLFRRWELPEIFEPHRRYHIEEAGAHIDGTPLLALYASDVQQSDGPSGCTDTGGHHAVPAISKTIDAPSKVVSLRIEMRAGRPQLLVTEPSFLRWLAGAKPGESLVYHRGVLIIDRLALGSRLSRQDALVLDRVAKAAMAAAESGRVHLVQRRHGDGDYSYIMVARGRRVVANTNSTELPESAR